MATLNAASLCVGLSALRCKTDTDIYVDPFDQCPDYWYQTHNDLDNNTSLGFDWNIYTGSPKVYRSDTTSSSGKLLHNFSAIVETPSCQADVMVTLKDTDFFELVIYDTVTYVVYVRSTTPLTGYGFEIEYIAWNTTTIDLALKLWYGGTPLGGGTQIGTTTYITISTTDTHDWEFKAVGSTFEVYRNGGLEASYTDSTYYGPGMVELAVFTTGGGFK